jgi:hypothetical protein
VLDAQATPDPRDDAPAIEAFLAAKEAVEGLTEEMTRANDLAEQRAEFEKERLEVDKRLASLAETRGPALLAGVIDAVTGGIGGRVGLGSRTPGVAGMPASYR